MNNEYRKDWFEFIKMGHKVKDEETKQIMFEIDGVKFELKFEFDSWFQLYRITGEYSKMMQGSDFYTLGRKDVHDMADDGIRHLKNSKEE